MPDRSHTPHAVGAVGPFPVKDAYMRAKWKRSNSCDARFMIWGNLKIIDLFNSEFLKFLFHHCIHAILFELWIYAKIRNVISIIKIKINQNQNY